MITFIVKGEGEFPTLEGTNCMFASLGSLHIATEEDGERMVRLLTRGEVPEEHFSDWGWNVVARMGLDI